MPTNIKLEFWGDVQLDRSLADIEDQTLDLRPVFEALADRFADLELRQFETEGRFGGSGWPALSPTYARWKATHYPGKTILRRTDDLFASLTSRPFGVEVLEPQTMVIGSDVDYGAFHQRGEGQKLRRPVELPETERVAWVRAIQRFIMTGEA